MTPKSVRVSLFQQILHELRTSYRRSLIEGGTRKEIDSYILEAMRERTKELSKYIAGIVLVSVSIENLRQETLLPIKTSLIEISIPAVYCAFLGSLLWFGFVISSLSMIQYISIKALSNDILYKWRRFSEAEWALSGSNFFDTTSPIRNGHLFEIWLPFRSALNFIYLSLVLILAVPLFGSLSSIFSISVNELRSNSGAYLGDSIALVTIALLVLPILYAILYFVPFPIRKRTSTIRWNFLVNLVSEPNELHPQSKTWLKK